MAIIAQKHQPYICALRQGELPTADELAPFDAILFTGGAGDAFSDEPWVVQVGNAQPVDMKENPSQPSNSHIRY